MAMKSLTGFDAASQRIVSVADPSGPADAVTKAYVDNLLAGLRWKAPVRAATTANGTLTTAFANGQTIDGVTLSTGDRILVKNQSTASQNGIYLVAVSGAPARVTDADSASELVGATVMVLSGTVNGDKAFTQTADTITVDTTDLPWVQVGGGTSYLADGQGLELSGATFGLELDGTTLTKGSAGLRVGSGAAGNGLTESSGVLAVNTGSGLEVSSDAVRIATGAVGTGLTGGGGSALAIDTSVVVRKYATNNPTMSAGTPTTITHNLNTRDVKIAVYEGTSGSAPEVFADPVVTGVNTITITSAAGNAADTLRVVVQG